MMTMRWVLGVVMVGAASMVLGGCGDGGGTGGGPGGGVADGFRPYNGNVPASSETAPGVDWGTSAFAFRGRDGLRVLYVCPTGGTTSTFWGTDVYTDDSSVCSAAVHVGRITLQGGGPVVIEVWPGQRAYPGSTRNGVQSYEYGAYTGSFIVL